MGGVAWTEEEDHLLRKCIEQYGEGKWHRVPLLAGLNRCRKSCRLRWLNYLRPNIKRGRFTDEEVELIIKLHKLLGNRWSLIAGRLPGRTANDVKNFWNCHLSKKLNTNLHGHLDNNNSNNTESNQCNEKMQPSAHIPIKEVVNNVTSIKSSSSSTSTTSNQPKSIIGAPSTLMLETTYAGAYDDHHNNLDRGVDIIGSDLGIPAAVAGGGGGSTCWRLSNKFDHMNITTTTNMAAAFHTHNNNNLLHHGGDGMNLQLGGSGGGGGGGYHSSSSIIHNVDNCKELQIINQYDHNNLFNYGSTEHHHHHNYNQHQHHYHGMMCSGQDNDHHQFIEMDEFDLEVEMKMCINHHSYYYDEQGKSKWDLDDLVMDMDLWGTTTTTTTTTDQAL